MSQVSLRSNKVAPTRSDSNLGSSLAGSVKDASSNDDTDGKVKDGGDGDEVTTTVDANAVTVPRTIGLVGGISFIVGTIIGSGIFISPKGIAEGCGSVGLSLIAWAACGVISMLGALCYAELGGVIRESGADYAFLQAAFGPVFSFMFAWVFSILLKPATLATLTLTCSQYILTLMFDDGCGAVPDVVKKLLALVTLFLLIGINVYSSKLAGRIQIIFTIAKVIALIIIIIGGIVKLFEGYTEHLATAFDGTESNPGTIAVGLYSGMFAYDGWNAANFITEEIIRPERNLPLSIIIGVPLVTIVYILTNISYFTVMSIDELIASPAVAITWAERVIPNAAWLIPIFVALSTFGSGNGSLFATGRLVFVAARNGHLPSMFSMVHVEKYTPIPACVLVVVLAIILILIGNVSSLITYLSFIKWIFYGMNMVSLIMFRYSKKYKDIKRPLRIPLVIPVIVLLAAIFIVVVPIVTDPQIEFLYAAIFAVVGFVFYIPLVHFKLQPKFMNYVTEFFQLYFQICKPVQE